MAQDKKVVDGRLRFILARAIGDAFVVVVVGGMGSVPGAFLAALLIAEIKAVCIAIGQISIGGFSLSLSRMTLVVEFLVMAAVLIWRREFFSASGLAGCMVLGAAVLLGGTAVMVGLWGVTIIPFLRDIMSRRRSFLSAHFLQSGDSLRQLIQRPGAILRGMALSLISLAAHFFCYYFSSRAFDAGLGVGQVFSIMPVVDTLTTLPVALYGVGLREALFSELLGTFFGISAAMATMVSLGGFGAQALVALSGIGFLPFVRMLGIREKR